MYCQLHFIVWLPYDTEQCLTLFVFSFSVLTFSYELSVVGPTRRMFIFGGWLHLHFTFAIMPNLVRISLR